MSEKASENSENRSRVVSALEEASQLVRYLAEPRPAGDSVRAAIQRSARRLRGWSASRVKDVWYADSRISISGDELNELRRLRQAADQQGQEAKARDEYRGVIKLLTRISEQLEALAPDAARTLSDLVREAAGAAGVDADAVGPVHRALDRE